MFSVYILRTSSNTLYIGQTNNLAKRLEEHRSKTGRGSKYLRSFPSFVLVYKEDYPTRSDALKREAALKRLTHAQKVNLIQEGATVKPEELPE